MHRYLPGRPFPAHTFTPGRQPHPRRSHDGPGAEDHLFAIDLFNHGYYWEAHEVWEGLWHAAGREGPIAALFKGLIRLAAAGVKVRQGIIESVPHVTCPTECPSV